MVDPAPPTRPTAAERALRPAYSKRKNSLHGNFARRQPGGICPAGWTASEPVDPGDRNEYRVSTFSSRYGQHPGDRVLAVWQFCLLRAIGENESSFWLSVQNSCEGRGGGATDPRRRLDR